MKNLFSFPALGYQRITVWYSSRDSFPDFLFYGDFGGMNPTIRLGKTHVPIVECYLEKCQSDHDYLQVCAKICHLMQGEMWSPNGEAQQLIKNSDTAHTSMSAGDIIQVGERYFIFQHMGTGFLDVSDKITVEV